MSESLRDELERRGAMLEGHFQLASGLHADLYIEKFRILQWPDVTGELCAEMAERFADAGANIVAGPTTGGVILAFEVARRMGLRAIIAERKEEGSGREFRARVRAGAGRPRARRRRRAHDGGQRARHGGGGAGAGGGGGGSRRDGEPGRLAGLRSAPARLPGGRSRLLEAGGVRPLPRGRRARCHLIAGGLGRARRMGACRRRPPAATVFS